MATGSEFLVPTCNPIAVKLFTDQMIYDCQIGRGASTRVRSACPCDSDLGSGGECAAFYPWMPSERGTQGFVLDAD